MKTANDMEETIKKNLNFTASAEMRERILTDVMNAQEEAQKTKSALAGPNIRSIITKSPITKLATAAVIFIAVLIGIHQFGGRIGVTTVAWSEVSDRFRLVPFFSATLYMKDNATAQPEQIELWMNQTGRSRFRYGNQIIFGNKGKITKAFDLKTLNEIEPEYRAVALANLLGKAEGYSLETVICSISGGELVDVTPLVNTNAVISEDLVVFDIESINSSQWYRIWALRASKLPVRIRMWDPRDGACADILLTYSKEQQEIFFDPEAFSSKAKSLRNTKEMNLAYMFLQTPAANKSFQDHSTNQRRFRSLLKLLTVSLGLLPIIGEKSS